MGNVDGCCGGGGGGGGGSGSDNDKGHEVDGGSWSIGNIDDAFLSLSRVFCLCLNVLCFCIVKVTLLSSITDGLGEFLLRINWMISPFVSFAFVLGLVPVFLGFMTTNCSTSFAFCS